MPTLKVNGKDVTIEAPAAMPLLWVLREKLALTGTKFGCGKGLCGSCTVHVDGVATRSCVTPVSSVTGAVTTIEGLSADGSHPVQQAWIEADAPQCGYCQPGQIMACAAMLKRTPKPTEQDIAGQMTNLCRCGTYGRIRQAIDLAVDLNAKAGG